MAHGDARAWKWRGNWRMEWVASTLHTASEHRVSSITTADAHTSSAGSRLNWRPRRFKWTRPFRRKTRSGFCACSITFQLASTVCSGGTRLRAVVTLEVATKWFVCWKSQVWFVVNCFVIWQALLPWRQEAKHFALKFRYFYTASKYQMLGPVIGSCIVTKRPFCTSISVNEIFDQEFNFSIGASTGLV